MIARQILAVAACCVPLSHAARSEEPEVATASTYEAYVLETVQNPCTRLFSLTRTNGGVGHASANTSALLQGACKGGAPPALADADSSVAFNPALIVVDIGGSGGGAADSDSILETVVTLHGPTTAKEVHVVEEFTVIGKITLTGSSAAEYTPCITVTHGKTVLGQAGCALIPGASGNIAQTWAVTATVPVTSGRAQIGLSETFLAAANTEMMVRVAPSASFAVTITPHQHIIESGWTYTAAGNFKPKP
jgi:hypothetical protein